MGGTCLSSSRRVLRSVHYLRLQLSSSREEANSGWQGGARANSIRNVGKLDLDSTSSSVSLPYHFAREEADGVLLRGNQTTAVDSGPSRETTKTVKRARTGTR